MKLVQLIRKIKNKPRAEWKILINNKLKDIKYAIPVSKDKAVLCIIGCQRSGSTMMYEIFSKDPRSKVYGEFCNLNSDDKDHKIRLNAVAKVKSVIDSLGHPLVILKPLVESQHVDKLLALHKNVKCVWLFRNYRDVAASNIKKWGPMNGKNNLLPIINQEPSNWRSESLPPETVSTVKKHYDENMSSHDAAALFWWVRNSLYFHQHLFDNSKIYTCNYKNLVSQPGVQMKELYQFIGVEYPTNSITDHVHANSVKKGKKIILSDGIEKLCQELYDNLCKYDSNGQ
jgi:hypothetical protein